MPSERSYPLQRARRSQPTSAMKNSNRTLRALCLFPLVLGLGALLSSSTAPAADPAPSAEDGRVIVLGFDGADARTIRNLMAERPDDYPNFRRLSESGTFKPLEGVAPPESPVSWAALNTGQNPAKTGVPGFVKRNLLGGKPAPGLGHLGSEKKPIEEFTNTPVPAWSETKYMGVLGGGGFLLGFLLFLAITRKKVVALILGLLLGAGGAYAGMTVRGYLPETAPRSTNPNKAKNFWDYAGDAGVNCVIIDPAQAFDMPTPEHVDMLAGLGVPDARGGIGEWFLYTTNPEEFSRPPRGRGDNLTAGTVYRVDEDGGTIYTKLYGPKNFWLEEKLQKEIDEIDEELSRPELQFERSMKLSQRKSELGDQLSKAKENRTNLDMTITREGDKARVKIGEQEQVIGEGEWSEFFELTFEMNPILRAHALTRVRLIHLEDPFFEMFVNVLDIDPRSPPFWQAISSPFSYSKEIADVAGLYETYGWPTATMPFKDGLVPHEVLCEDVEFTLNWRENVTRSQLERDDWKVLMSVFSTTDRIQHMMYRYYDKDHPMHDPVEAAREISFFGERVPLSETIPMIYKQMDRVIGDVLDNHVRDGDTFIVCSDHGFQSFRRQVHVNNVLAELGYLALKPIADKNGGKGLAFVDWDNTRAYSLGMGFIYLNLEGRESRGIVKQSEAKDLLRKIREDFMEVRDPENGAKICNDAYITEEVHSGEYLDLEGDMLMGFAPTYRVSWDSTFGGLGVEEDELGGYKASSICEDNDSLWSGGHVSVALPDVAGVFFSNRKLADMSQTVQALAIGPTVLNRIGVEIPAEMDTGPVEFAD